jgi:hypothetical protein
VFVHGSGSPLFQRVVLQKAFFILIAILGSLWQLQPEEHLAVRWRKCQKFDAIRCNW